MVGLYSWIWEKYMGKIYGHSLVVSLLYPDPKGFLIENDLKRLLNRLNSSY